MTSIVSPEKSAVCSIVAPLKVKLCVCVCVYVYRRGTERGRETETGLSQGMGLQSCGSWSGNLRSAGQDIRKGRA